MKRLILFTILAMTRFTSWAVSVGDTFTYTYGGRTLTYKITNVTNRYVQVGDDTKAAIDNTATGG